MKTRNYTTFLLSFALAAILAVPVMGQTASDDSSVDFTIEDATSIQFNADWTGFNITWNTTSSNTIADGITYETNSGVTKVIEHTNTAQNGEPSTGASDDITINLAADNLTTDSGDTGTPQGPITVWDGANGDQSTQNLITDIGATDGIVQNGTADATWGVTTNNAESGTYTFSVELTISNQ